MEHQLSRLSVFNIPEHPSRRCRMNGLITAMVANQHERGPVMTYQSFSLLKTDEVRLVWPQAGTSGEVFSVGVIEN